jgi:hypothetical protein
MAGKRSTGRRGEQRRGDLGRRLAAAMDRGTGTHKYRREALIAAVSPHGQQGTVGWGRAILAI